MSYENLAPMLFSVQTYKLSNTRSTGIYCQTLQLDKDWMLTRQSINDFCQFIIHIKAINYDDSGEPTIADIISLSV